jgi:hypothetical protein
MRHEMLALEPSVLFLDQQTMDAQVAATLLPARAGRSASAPWASWRCCSRIGLYGVIGYACRRARGIGIRGALGATAGAVVSMVLTRLRDCSSRRGSGSLLALGAAKAVDGRALRRERHGPVAWIGSITALFAVAALANLAPARRRLVDPLPALRSE